MECFHCLKHLSCHFLDLILGELGVVLFVLRDDLAEISLLERCNHMQSVVIVIDDLMHWVEEMIVGELS